MPGHDHKGLLVGHNLEVFLDQPVLHPILADLTGLAVGYKLIGIERDVKVQIVVDHDLEGFGFDAVALVFVDGLAVQLALRTEAVAIDPAPLLQLQGKFLCHLSVVLLGDIAQGIGDGPLFVLLGEVRFAPWRSAVLRIKGRIAGKLVVQTNGDGGSGIKFHDEPSFGYGYYVKSGIKASIADNSVSERTRASTCSRSGFSSRSSGQKSTTART